MSTTAYYGDIPISQFVEALANLYYEDVNTMCIDEVIQVIIAHETEDNSEEIAHIVRTTPNKIYVTALAKASSDLGPLNKVFKTGTEQVNNQNVMETLLTEVIYLRNSSYLEVTLRLVQDWYFH